LRAKPEAGDGAMSVRDVYVYDEYGEVCFRFAAEIALSSSYIYNTRCIVRQKFVIIHVC